MKSQGFNVFRIHPLGTQNVSTKFPGSPFKSPDISTKIKKVQPHGGSDKNDNSEIACKLRHRVQCEAEWGWERENHRANLSLHMKRKVKRFLKGRLRGRLGSHSAAPGRQMDTLRTCGPVMVTMGTAVFNREQVLYSHLHGCYSLCHRYTACTVEEVGCVRQHFPLLEEA